MGWKDLIKEDKNQIVVYPWCGEREITSNSRTFTIKGKMPEEFGWYEFEVSNRNAYLKDKVEPQPDVLEYEVTGYLARDRFIPDNVASLPEISLLTKQFETIKLLEPGLDKFIRIKAGRTYEGGKLIYYGEEFPLGPEDDVLNAFLEEQISINHIKEVSPSLDCAFRYETWHRSEIRRIREEERIRREKEERRRKIRESLGNGALRRELALDDFEAAATAALAVGGAVYLDHRQSRRRDEMIVRFRLLNQRFECTCNYQTMRIIDSGICLTDHYTGESGDTYFTLESLPSVINEAYGGGLLHRYRHV